jgi:hypothetical protein
MSSLFNKNLEEFKKRIVDARSGNFGQFKRGNPRYLRISLSIFSISLSISQYTYFSIFTVYRCSHTYTIDNMCIVYIVEQCFEPLRISANKTI